MKRIILMMCVALSAIAQNTTNLHNSVEAEWPKPGDSNYVDWKAVREARLKTQTNISLTVGEYQELQQFRTNKRQNQKNNELLMLARKAKDTNAIEQARAALLNTNSVVIRP